MTVNPAPVHTRDHAPVTPAAVGRSSPNAHGFDTTAAYSIGSEEEFLLVDSATGELVQRAASVLSAFDPDHPGSVAGEVVTSVVESATPICTSVRELEASLVSHRLKLADAARESGCLLAAAGTHPFTSGEQPVSSGERYAELARNYPWVFQEAASTCGLHVHIGIPGADRAIRVCNVMRHWLPHMLALSANSPFRCGTPTGLQSTRILLTQLYPRSGVPPIFADYQDYVDTVQLLQLGTSVADFTHMWWMVRPQPRYGTIELRACDAQTDVRWAAALAAMTQALAAWINEGFDAGGAEEFESAAVCEENVWAAARDGCAGYFIEASTGIAISKRRAIRELLHALTPYFSRFGSTDYVPALHEMLVHNAARVQLDDFASGRSVQQIVQSLAARTEPTTPLAERPT